MVNKNSWFFHDSESENCAEHCGDIWTEPVCAGNRVDLRLVDGDGIGGLTAVGMVNTARG